MVTPPGTARDLDLVSLWGRVHMWPRSPCVSACTAPLQPRRARVSSSPAGARGVTHFVRGGAVVTQLRSDLQTVVDFVTPHLQFRLQADVPFLLGTLMPHLLPKVTEHMGAHPSSGPMS